jgi:hypothetical protein
MATTMPFKNILVIGGSGNLGKIIVQHLRASEHGFNVVVLSRKSSSATFPSWVDVRHVADDYPPSELVEAFQGVDVVVSAISMLGMQEQYKFINAAVEARVQRFFPTEYGLDEIPSWLENIRPVFRIKHEVREYLKSKEREGLSWTGIVCNSLFEFAVLHGLGQVDLNTKVVELVDGGTTEWASTTLDTVGLAIVRSIEKSEQTKNRELFVQDFLTSQKEILEALKTRTGPWMVTVVESEAWLSQAMERVRNGDNSQLPKLAFSLMGMKGTGVDFRQKENYANELLDLPTKTFQEAVQPLLSQVE